MVVGTDRFPLRSHQVEALESWRSDGDLAGMLAVAKDKLCYVNMRGEHVPLEGPITTTTTAATTTSAAAIGAILPPLPLLL